MSYRIVAVSGRPDLAPVVARWHVTAFFDYPGGCSIEHMTALILAPPVSPKQTFVLFEDGQPAGTAGLVPRDVDTRLDLTPWLAGVFVEPRFRGRGFATALVRQVEAFARAAEAPILWLCTGEAERLYRRLGWQRMGIEQDRGQDVVLMRRVLAEA